MTDSLDILKSILNSDWDSSNTDDIKPEVEIITDVKLIDAANNDFILLYEMNEPILPFGLGGVDWHHEKLASVDIRTTYKKASIENIRPHLIKMKEEVFRIIKARISTADTNHQLLKLISKKDLSDKSIGIGRMVIDVSLNHWGELN